MFKNIILSLLLISGNARADFTDNLGNHSATQNIKLNAKYLSGDGGDEGISISSTGVVTFSTGTLGVATSFTTPLVLGGTGTTSTLSLQTTSGVGTTNADMIFKVGNNGATEAARILNNGRMGVGTASPGATFHVGGTDSIIVPSGTTGQRSGTPVAGMLRYNSTLTQLEFYDSTWRPATGRPFYKGSHATNCSFARSANTFGDPAADSTCTYTELLNSGFGTVTSYLSGSDPLPGIVFTPSRSGATYYICADVHWQVASGLGEIQLIDGASTVIFASPRETSSTQLIGFNYCGLYTAPDANPQTLKLQVKHASSSAVTILGTSSSYGIYWNLQQIN